MKFKIKIRSNKTKGFGLIVLLAIMIVISIVAVGVLSISYGLRFQAIKLKAETDSILAAEAGYEEAIFWMSKQPDMLYVFKNSGVYTDSISFQNNAKCNYEITFFSFLNSRPAFKIISKGTSGLFNKTIEAIVLQDISGWDMGLCRVPMSSSSTDPVYYANGEIIDMPIHINKANDSPDVRDIFISGSPQFIAPVSMGESRYTGGGSDKYSSVMGLFDAGIDFDQPSSKIADEEVIKIKIERFKDSTKSKYTLTPNGRASVSNPQSAVQLEFFVNNSGTGRVRVTNNCTVRGFAQSRDNRTLDFKVRPGSGGSSYQRYYIYGYHVIPDDAVDTGERFTANLTNTYVTQSVSGIESDPGGQIYVDGNVIIGGDGTRHNNGQVVKGKITVVATGNIWIADSLIIDGPHDADGKPSADNENALGLLAGGVIKVVDPGMADYSYVDNYPRVPSHYEYIPIGIPDPGQAADSYRRYLPDPMVVEASITVGGGGWGAENVQRGYYGGRKEASGRVDDLVVRGTITEVIRGVVGIIGSDGFLKHYYFDERFVEGILPGDMWLRGKYSPAPAGWVEYRTD